MPADVDNGSVEFVNGTRRFKSLIRYSCDEGHYIVGQATLR